MAERIKSAPPVAMMVDLRHADLTRTFSMLSSMFLCEPTSATLQQWREMLVEETPDSLGVVKEALEAVDLNSAQEMDDILWEYTRLFVGPYKLPCPPWESVYTSPKRLLMQTAYDEVICLYREAGLAMHETTITPDHIAAETNFCALLLQKMSDEPESRSLYAEITQRLVHGHLLQWVPRFTQDMEQSAESPLYKALAQTTRECVFACSSAFPEHGCS